MNQQLNGPIKAAGKYTYGIQKLSLAGLIITLGIVYGDIGTSPLYVMKAISNNLNVINRETIYGAVSCVFWTLTLQTTLKYILITLRADNKGEGGILALFALIRRKSAWAYVIALVGCSTILAEGIITPSITVTSAVEGLRIINPEIPVVAIVIIIVCFLFFMQQFGTNFLGKSFGPIMFIWFSMLAVLGLFHVVGSPEIFAALNPVYGIKLLTLYPGALFILGAVFLATTGAEALYSDLGHCGIKNIRVSWIFVKISLVLNYLGQAQWILNNPEFDPNGQITPFYGLMPEWFLLPGIIIATIAAIIASQAMISGSFTLVSEGISLNFWPKMLIKYPTEVKGQMYVPQVNLFLWIGCLTVVLFFQESSKMEAAYGLSISITMLMSTTLLIAFMRNNKVPTILIVLFAITYYIIETSFLSANLTKFRNGGWMTVVIAGIFSLMMYSWYNGRKLKNSLMTFIKLNKTLDILHFLKTDLSIPKFATNLVYITKANKKDEIESTIEHSLLHKQPKRADVYWLLHVDVADDPYTFEYEVTHLLPGTVIKVDFYLGFKIDTRINRYFRQIVEDLSNSEEIDILSRYPSLRDFGITGDFRYILIDRILTSDLNLNVRERLIMNISDTIKVIGIPEAKSLYLDVSNATVEKVPLGRPEMQGPRIKRKEKVQL